MASAEGSVSTISSTTSQTLTHTAANKQHVMAATATSPHEAASMLAFLDNLQPTKRYIFLQPPSSMSSGGLHWAKYALDAFAGQVGDEQATRRIRGKKRKREKESATGDVLRLRKLHIDGFGIPQVWQQAQRIIQSTLGTAEDILQEMEECGQITRSVKFPAVNGNTASDNASEGSQPNKADGDFLSNSGEEAWEDAASHLKDRDRLSGANRLSGAKVVDDLEDLDDQDVFEDGEGHIEDEYADDFNHTTETFVEDPNGLNDGFFSIDDFNKQTQYFEQQDARAVPHADQASDDEEIDWHTDPFSQRKGTFKYKKSKTKDENEVSGLGNGNDDDEEDARPTFGNMALNALDGESDDEAVGTLADGIQADLGMDLTADDIFYKDFFEPPPKKAKKGDEPRRARPPERIELTERDMERAMEDVHGDLFEDLSENSNSEDAPSNVSAGDPKSRRSAHERRQAKLAEEIRRMESELVAKRAWTLSGEASATKRPMNSLLEEDLDFEYAGKPLPVVTEETSEDIEALVKRRIIAGEFDEVVKKRPYSDASADTRRGLVELNDTKAKQSLAELYEEEHVKNTNPDSYLSAKNDKMRKEEKQIESLWIELSARLDALSSWHFKPKPAAPSLTVVADVATVTMEDAQPTTAQGVSGGASMIAPQEVYNPGKNTAEQGELVAKSGLPTARQEMTREDKVRRRRRVKERMKKAGAETTKLSKKAQGEKQVMADLRKGGVQIINKKGQLLDMDGKQPQASKIATSNSFKL